MTQEQKPHRVMAIAAHPDDIEFLMAGTFLLLGEAGCELHYMTVSSGNCGSMVTNAKDTRRIRKEESIDAANLLGAHYHSSLADDLEIFYEPKLLRRLAAVLREVAPSILLIPSLEDYMEDHMNTARLAVTATFVRGMPNYRTLPSRKPVPGDATIYHAMPHGLRDGMRRRITPELFVNTASVHDQKRAALSAHRSQKEWLDATQGMDSYLQVMDEMSLDLGKESGKFKHAEGWRRHSHLGFGEAEADPVRDLLKGKCVLNRAYQSTLR